MPSLPRRSPATAADQVATYPTLDERGDARRRFLKLCAISSVSGALGLQLVGCPSKGGVNDGTWVPWDGPHVAGGKMPPPEDAPVALVIGGGPIQVTFRGGEQAKLVVAAVVVPRRGQDVRGDVSSKAAEHAQLVQKLLKEHPVDMLGDAASLGDLEDLLRAAINRTVAGGYIKEISIARARPPRPKQEAAGDEKAALEEPAAPAKRAPARAPTAGKPAGKVAPPPENKLAKVKQIWAPCRRSGCTTCGR